jgi:hypothetical protein
VAAGRDLTGIRAGSVAIAAAGVGVKLPRLLSGDDLVELGYGPGPAFGRILAEVEAARSRREIAGRDDARAWVLARFARGGHGAGPVEGLMEA